MATNTCDLCLTADAVGLCRVSGLEFCQSCRMADPADRLAKRGVAVEWYAAMLRFNAGLGLSGLPGELYLRCVPETLGHKLVKLGFGEVEVGDPTFDNAVFVRTNDPARAAALLAHEGIQSALLGLLMGLRVNELMPNHVTLDGRTLTVSIRPLDGLDEDKLQELKLEAAALALHLVAQEEA